METPGGASHYIPLYPGISRHIPAYPGISRHIPDPFFCSRAEVGDGASTVVGPSLVVKRGGDTATALLRLAAQVGVADRVVWVGPVPPERALDFLAAADALVVPSHLESLNKVCVEAAAVGTPFVVTETTGVSAWVPDDGIGLVVPPNDPTAIARAVTRVLEGSDGTDEHVRRAFVQRFSPGHVAEQMAEIYQEAAAGRGEPV